MAEVSLRDYRFNILAKEYNKFSDELRHFQNHIERCNNEDLITGIERNSYLKTINELLTSMNITYNKHCAEIYDSTNSTTESEGAESLAEIFPVISSTNINLLEDVNSLVDLCTVFNLDTQDVSNLEKYQNLFITSFFTDIKKTLLDKIASHIGFYNIVSALDLLIGTNYVKHFDKNTVKLLDYYNKIFIPMNYKELILMSEERPLFFKKKILIVMSYLNHVLIYLL